MPKKDGKAAYEEIQAIRKGVPVLFTSGYAADFVSKKGILAAGVSFISKPVTPNLLLSKVREAFSH